jgi:hypothetical protein
MKMGQAANGYSIKNGAVCMKRPGRPQELDFMTKLRVSTAMVVLPLMIPPEGAEKYNKVHFTP